MVNAAAKSKYHTKFFIASLLIFLLVGAGFAIAGEKGRVEFEGRTIILNDDNTWEFVSESRQVVVEKKETAEEKTANADSPDCVLFASNILPVSACLDEKVWQIGAKSDAAEFSFSTKSEKLYMLMITEKDEVPLEDFEKAIVANAQKAAGLNPVEIIVQERINALDLDWGRMVYIANIDGLKIQYENYFTTIKGKGSVQYVFYATPEDYDEHALEIEKVTTQIAVN